MYTWRVTITYDDGLTIERTEVGLSLGDVLRILLTSMKEHLYYLAIDHIDVQRVKEHGDAE